MARLCNGKVASAFQSWIEEVKIGHCVDRLLKRVKARMSGESLMYMFELWAHNVKEVNRKREVVNRIMMQIMSPIKLHLFLHGLLFEV